jgi:hypothetical protein
MRPLYIKTSVDNKTLTPLNAASYQTIRNLKYSEYSSPEVLLQAYQKSNPDKIKLSLAIGNILRRYEISSMISFGCGESVIEYIIKKNNSRLSIYLSDFDKEILSHNRKVYGTTFEDYLYLDIASPKMDITRYSTDLALVNGVIYVLDDIEAGVFFKNLPNNGMHTILLVHTAEINIYDEIKRLFKSIIFKDRFESKSRNAANTFWGWARYKRDIVKLARKQGFKLVEYSKPNFGYYKRGIYVFQQIGNDNCSILSNLDKE